MKDVETKILEIGDSAFEYLVRIHSDISYQEFQVEGRFLEDFLKNCFREGYDVFVYKLVQSYEEF